MKFAKIISVLLVSVMLLASCSQAVQNETEKLTDAILENIDTEQESEIEKFERDFIDETVEEIKSIPQTDIKEDIPFMEEEK